ncbi:hypothetical protein ACFX19_045388 [Malus domestica]
MRSKAAEGSGTGSTGIDVDVDGQDENGVQTEEDESVDSYGLAVGLHVPKLHLLAVSRSADSIRAICVSVARIGVSDARQGTSLRTHEHENEHRIDIVARRDLWFAHHSVSCYS